MTVARGHKILAMPGPTNVPSQVIQAMNRPAIDIYAGEAIETTTSCLKDLKSIFRTNGETFIYIANGHGIWEAALTNLFSAGDTVLVPICGHFPLTWSLFAERLGIKVKFIEENNERAANDPDLIRKILTDDKDHNIKAILQVHIDTASGVVNDLQAIRQAIDDADHPALLVVDAIASLGIAPLEMDSWGVDVTLSASQKGLMMTPGLGFIAANNKAIEISKSAKLKTGYWDWNDRIEGPHYKKYCGTAPIHLMMGLRKSLDLMLEETMEGIWTRHEHLAAATRRSIEVWSSCGELSFNVLADDHRSNAVTTVLFEDGPNSNALANYCRNNFSIILGTGIGRFEGRAIRVAHMGDINESIVLATLGVIETSLIALSIPHGSGGIQAAINYFANHKKT